MQNNNDDVFQGVRISGLPITDWICSVCYEHAQVMTSGETLCIKHAKEWGNGYGKNLKQLSDEYKMSTMLKKQSK